MKDIIFEEFKKLVDQTIDLPIGEDSNLLEDMVCYLNNVLDAVEIGREVLSST